MARPTHVEARWRWPRRRCLCSCQGAGVRLIARRVEAGSEGVEPPAVGFGDRDTTVTQAQVRSRHDVVRGYGRSAGEIGEKCCVLPAHDRPAGIGRVPSSRLHLMIEICAGRARGRAEARQGLTLDRSFGGEDACHRNDDDRLFAAPCQPLIAVGGRAAAESGRNSQMSSASSALARREVFKLRHVMTERCYGDGSIYRRSVDGRWYGALGVGREGLDPRPLRVIYVNRSPACIRGHPEHFRVPGRAAFGIANREVHLDATGDGRHTGSLSAQSRRCPG